MDDRMIDVTFEFQAEAGTRDPDSYSRTLQRYHRLLWSKPLPSGQSFMLEPVRVGSALALRHESQRGTFVVSSDTLANSNKKRLPLFYEQMGAEANAAWHRDGGAIGGRIVFPRNRVDGKQTINQLRGTHHQIRDRFDLTLEAIRRHYAEETSPLTEVLARYDDFFALFETFDGYVSFFLLQDLVDDGAVRFYLPFSGFEESPLPRTFEDYVQFRRAQMDFVSARNARILEAVDNSVHEQTRSL